MLHFNVEDSTGCPHNFSLGICSIVALLSQFYSHHPIKNIYVAHHHRNFDQPSVRSKTLFFFVFWVSSHRLSFVFFFSIEQHYADLSLDGKTKRKRCHFWTTLLDSLFWRQLECLFGPNVLFILGSDFWFEYSFLAC